MDEQELHQLITSSEEIYKMLGGEKKSLPEEKVTIDFAFATVVSIKDIKKGEIISLDNVWAKRPGTGQIRAAYLNDLIGMVAVKDIPNDTHLDYTMVKKI